MASNWNPESTHPSDHCSGQNRAELLELAKQGIRDRLEFLTRDEVEVMLGGFNALCSNSAVDELHSDWNLIGLLDRDGTYLYPAFQLDADRHQVHPVVTHANRALHAATDPYGAASWWLTTTAVLSGCSPLDKLADGTLNVIAVNNILAFQRQGV
ncbi:hypothetical protein [Rhodococcus baikonurensis]|uniref:Uncharacterized protein n=1 Tax=Rhodococcus baikonurensis TaxID=172041 RepID=A0ABV5XTN0_9NOCA